MSLCEREDSDTGNCAPTEDSSSDGSVEGKWIGISVAIWIVLLTVVWLIRTCTNRVRREQALHRFCCRGKKTDQDGGSPEAGRHIPDNCNDPIYYNPCAPPSYEEVMNGSPRPNRKVGYYSPESPDTGQEEDTSLPARGRPVHKMGMRKSRTSLSAISLSLEPIQEDDNEPKHGSEPQLPSYRDATLEHGRLPSIPCRSTTYPGRLTSLHTQAETTTEYDEEDETCCQITLGGENIRDTISGKEKVDIDHKHVNGTICNGHVGKIVESTKESEEEETDACKESVKIKASGNVEVGNNDVVIGVNPSGDV